MEQIRELSNRPHVIVTLLSIMELPKQTSGKSVFREEKYYRSRYFCWKKKNDDNSFFQELLFLDGGKHGTNHMNIKSDKRFVPKGKFERKRM